MKKITSAPHIPSRRIPLVLLATAFLILASTACRRSEEPAPPVSSAGAAAPQAPAQTPADVAPAPVPAETPAVASNAPRPEQRPDPAQGATTGARPESRPAGSAPAEAASTPPVVSPPPPPEPPPPPPEFVIASGTSFKFKIQNDLSGKDSPVGNKFKGKMLTNLTGEGGTIPSAGWTVRGRVAQIVPPASQNQSGEMLLEITEMVTTDGRSIPLVATLGVSGTDTKGRNVGIIAGSAVAGAVLGKQVGNKSGTNAAIGGVVGAAGGAVGAKYAKGRHAKIEKGQELQAFIQAELRVPKAGI